MRFFRYIAYGLACIITVAILGGGTAWLLTAPPKLPKHSESSRRLQPGPFEVARVEYQWIDQSRPTPKNGSFEGSPERALPSTLWFPKDADGEHPLVIYAHGIYSSRQGGTYLAEHLASHGYVVIAADFPLTHNNTLGGPNYKDVVNQPADVSFLIDKVLGLQGEQRFFAGTIDTDRIGATGLSLGGATIALASFHPAWRDDRISAAVVMAAPGDIFGPDFFDHASVPLLWIAGTADAIVNYDLNASPIPSRAKHSGLVTIAGGTHAGFENITAGWIRVLGNPDNIGCGATSDVAEGPGDAFENVFAGLFGTEKDGLITPQSYQPPCSIQYEDVMRAGHQQMVTAVAVRAFFDSKLSPNLLNREEHSKFLSETFPAELDEVTYTPSRRLIVPGE